MGQGSLEVIALEIQDPPVLYFDRRKGTEELDS